MKQLFRSRINRKFLGVCGGLGEYFQIDPTLVRIAFLFFACMAGSGLLCYLLMALVIPEAPGM